MLHELVGAIESSLWAVNQANASKTPVQYVVQSRWLSLVNPYPQFYAVTSCIILVDFEMFPLTQNINYINYCCTFLNVNKSRMELNWKVSMYYFQTF